MRRTGPRLTDDDLARLVRLGGSPQTIAEAAGVAQLEVRARLARSVGAAAGPVQMPEPAHGQTQGSTQGQASGRRSEPVPAYGLG